MKIQVLSENSFLIKSDNDNLYKVQLSGEKKNLVTCTCRGFKFRRDCQHARAVKDILANKGRMVKSKPAPKDPHTFIEPYKEQIIKQLGMK